VTDAAVPVDARGEARAALGADIGAYEAPGTFDTPPLRVATAADIIDHDDGLASLRDAIALLNAGMLSGTITFASGVGEAFESASDVILGETGLVISGAVSIYGDMDDGDLVIGCAGASRIISIDFDGLLDLSNAALAVGASTGDGGAVLVQTGGARTLDTVILANNTATGGDGDAVFVAAGATLMRRDVQRRAMQPSLMTRSSGNLAVRWRSKGWRRWSTPSSSSRLPIMAAPSRCRARSCRWPMRPSGKTPAFSAAARLLVTVASAVIDHATVTGNRALVEHGGGIAVAQSNLTLTNSIVVGNGLCVRTDGRDISVADAVLTAGRDALTGAGAPSTDPDCQTRVLADEGLGAADIFTAISPFQGAARPPTMATRRAPRR
jgi:hypothetical protein